MRILKRVSNLHLSLLAALVALLIIGGSVLAFTYFSDEEDSADMQQTNTDDESMQLAPNLIKTDNDLCYREATSAPPEFWSTICYEVEENEAFFRDIYSPNREQTYGTGESIEFQITLIARHETSTDISVDSAYLDLNIPAARADFIEVQTGGDKVRSCTAAIPAICGVESFFKTLVFRYVVQRGHNVESLTVERLVLGEGDYILGPQQENLLPDGNSSEIDRQFAFKIDTDSPLRIMLENKVRFVRAQAVDQAGNSIKPDSFQYLQVNSEDLQACGEGTDFLNLGTDYQAGQSIELPPRKDYLPREERDWDKDRYICFKATYSGVTVYKDYVVAGNYWDISQQAPITVSQPSYVSRNVRLQASYGVEVASPDDELTNIFSTAQNQRWFYILIDTNESCDPFSLGDNPEEYTEGELLSLDQTAHGRRVCFHAQAFSDQTGNIYGNSYARSEVIEFAQQ